MGRRGRGRGWPKGWKGWGVAATIGEKERGSARVGEERGAPIYRIEINGPNTLSHLSCRPQRKKCQKIYCFPEECLLKLQIPMPQNMKEKRKKINFFSENWGITITHLEVIEFILSILFIDSAFPRL
jgi:hypothetical protein